MASDNWHHLEGTYLPTGVFRMHLYDDYTKPLPVDEMRRSSARLVTKDVRPGDADDQGIDDDSAGAERTVPRGADRQAAAARGDDGEGRSSRRTTRTRFDFTFEAYSKEPVAGAPVTTTTTPAPAAAAPSRWRPRRRRTPPRRPRAGDDRGASNVDPALVPAADSRRRFPKCSRSCARAPIRFETFIDRGSFASIYVPAFQAKDLALALDEHKRQLPPEKRRIAAAGDHEAGSIGVAARRVRRHRQQAADLRGVREVRRSGERHPRVLSDSQPLMAHPEHDRPRNRSRNVGSASSLVASRRGGRRALASSAARRTRPSRRSTPTTTTCFRSSRNGARAATSPAASRRCR